MSTATANGQAKPLGPPDMQAYREELKEAAADLIDRGFRVTVCNGKSPQRIMGKGWQRKRLTAEEANRLIDKAKWPTIGIMQGGVGGIVDPETDSKAEQQTLLELFDGDPVPTACYSSGRGAHWPYRADPRVDATGAGVINYIGSNGAKLGVRIGGNGAAAHSCVPPSYHAELVDRDRDEWRWTGKRYEWRAEIDNVGIAKLPDSVVHKLLSAHAKKHHATTTTTANVHAGALAAMQRSTSKQDDSGDGSKRLYTCACRAVGFDLSDDEAVATTHAYATLRPFPKSWTDAQILQRVPYRQG